MADDIFSYSIVGFFAGLLFFIKGFFWLQEKRLIENTPTSKVRSIAMGLVEVFGSVVPKKDVLLQSPFAKKDCVYYRYVVEELRHTKNSTYWAIVGKGSESTRFYLKDATGQVLVDPTGANIDIPADFEFQTGLGKSTPKNIQTFLTVKHIGFQGFLGFGKTMRYREYVLEPKDKVYVLGTAGNNPEVADTTETKNEEGIMIQKEKRLYYISDRPEKEILNSYKWKVIGGLVGGPVLALVCLAIILGYL